LNASIATGGRGFLWCSVITFGRITVEKHKTGKQVRPRVASGSTVRVDTGCGHLYITANLIDGKLAEVFAHLGKSGGCAAAQNEALCRVISVALRYGVPLEALTKGLIGIQCPNPAWSDGLRIKSCPDAIGQMLRLPAEPDTKEAAQ
jgi:ribonucleoside-diphosphate reductase alpha chain